MKKILSLAILTILSIGLLAQTITSSQIDDLVNKTLEAFEVPGIAVGIIKDGEAIHMKGYGVRSLDTNIPMDEKTLFGIASNSKAFTAAALGILKEEGKLDWDDKVVDYIPEFRLYNSYVTEDFRIRDLLCHRSGMGLGAGDLMIWPDGTDFSRMDVINNLKHLKQVSPFRTKYDYDNLLYIVAGEIVGKVSGLGWEKFIEERIMKPLNMKRSASSFKRLNDISNVIDPHALVGGKVQVVSRTTNELMNAAGGIYSSVEDMAKWANFLMKQANDAAPARGESRLGPNGNTIQELWTPQTIIPVRNPGHYNTHFAAYGLGFRLADEKGYKVVSHTGGLAGMVTKMTLIPEMNLAIIVFTNQQSGAAFSAITNQIKDAYFGLSGVNWVERYISASSGSSTNANKILKEVFEVVDSNMERMTNDEKRMTTSKILGKYSDPWFGLVNISNKENKTIFSAERSPGLVGEIFWYKGNTYIVKWNDRSMDADAFLLFDADFNGEIKGLKMKAISPLTDFSFDFHDLDFSRIR